MRHGRYSAEPLDLTNPPQQFLDRFWSKVDHRGPDECWEWTASRKPAGYGQFTLRKGKFVTASRVALALSIGRPLFHGEQACHRCDNPPCCNPRHLFAGTAFHNAIDSVQKGRARRVRGVDTPSNRLTEAQVLAIRAAGDEIRTAALARHYGVSTTTIASIRKGAKWRHVA